MFHVMFVFCFFAVFVLLCFLLVLFFVLSMVYKDGPRCADHFGTGVIEDGDLTTSNYEGFKFCTFLNLYGLILKILSEHKYYIT